ncbi:MAG: hypothetical protein WC346_05070 [Methanogenium sp.]|jgi:hypothetical protein
MRFDTFEAIINVIGKQVRICDVSLHGLLHNNAVPDREPVVKIIGVCAVYSKHDDFTRNTETLFTDRQFDPRIEFVTFYAADSNCNIIQIDEYEIEEMN